MILIYFLYLQLILVFALSTKVPHPSEFKDMIFSSDKQFLPLHFSSSKSNFRIINGFQAILGQFPHAVFLLMKSNTNKTFGCGGSLIRSNWILTAAHCLMNKVHGYAYAGVVDIFRGPYGFADKFELDQMFPHQNFTLNNPNFECDIGLIMLTEDMPLNQYISVIDLPSNCLDCVNTNGAADITVTGFGYTNINAPGVSSLKYITMAVMENLECQKFFEIPIQDSMLCSNTSLGMTTW